MHGFMHSAFLPRPSGSPGISVLQVLQVLQVQHLQPVAHFDLGVPFARLGVHENVDSVAQVLVQLGHRVTLLVLLGLRSRKKKL